MLEKLTVEDFNPHVGTPFHVVSDGNALDLKLERVAAVMESERARLQRQPFSLFFRGPLEPHLPQKIYDLRHEGFPEPLSIFIVPVGRTSEGIQYEAVFT